MRVPETEREFKTPILFWFYSISRPEVVDAEEPVYAGMCVCRCVGRYAGVCLHACMCVESVPRIWGSPKRAIFFMMIEIHKLMFG